MLFDFLVAEMQSLSRHCPQRLTSAGLALAQDLFVLLNSLLVK
jgi:hypothetical protein